MWVVTKKQSIRFCGDPDDDPDSEFLSPDKDQYLRSKGQMSRSACVCSLASASPLVALNDCVLLIKAYITIAIRLRYDDTTTYSTTTEVIEITICIRFDCDTTTTRLPRKIDMLIFCSRRIVSNGSRRARYVVVGS